MTGDTTDETTERRLHERRFGGDRRAGDENKMVVPALSPAEARALLGTANLLLGVCGEEARRLVPSRAFLPLETAVTKLEIALVAEGEPVCREED